MATITPGRKTNMNIAPNCWLAALATTLFIAPVAQAMEEEPVATPYRPSVSMPAALPVPGWLDMEFGWQRTNGGGDKRRESFPVTAKLALNADWGIVVGGELRVRRTDQSDTIFTGGGDTTFLVKHRIATADEGIAWGVVAGVKSPTAKHTIGSGKRDATIMGILSTDFAENYHFDANLTLTQQGARDAGEGNVQTGWAAAVSRSLNDQWGIFAEPSSTSRSATKSTGQFLFGASYNVSKQMVLDIAAAKRMNNATPDWQIMFGLTSLLGRLWSVARFNGLCQIEA